MTKKLVDSTLKVMLVGDAGTGKTSLVTRLTKGIFDPAFENKNVINIDNHAFQIKDDTFQLCIWDLAGGQDYRATISSAYHGASGIILVYDISNRSSFENCAGWLKEIRSSGGSKSKVMLLGNKNDLKAERVVTTQEAQTFADDNGLLFFETSALTEGHIESAYEQMVIALTATNDTQPFQVVLVDIKKAAKGEIHCVEKPLQDDLRFVALSYRWGELPESTVDTGLGYVTSVKSFSLGTFYDLCRLMTKEWDLKSIEFVWVDAICVDQNNYERRKATIYHMTEIYEHATYIVAVPDLHLEYLKNVSTHNKSLVPDLMPATHSDYIYRLIHGNHERLYELDHDFLDLVGVPEDPSLREWLTHCTDYLTDGLTKYRGHRFQYEPLKALDHLYESIEAEYQSRNGALRSHSKSDRIARLKEEIGQKYRDIWSKKNDSNNNSSSSSSSSNSNDNSYNNNLSEWTPSVHYCNEEHCPLDNFFKEGSPWQKQADLEIIRHDAYTRKEQVGIQHCAPYRCTMNGRPWQKRTLDDIGKPDIRPWNEEIVERSTLIQQTMHFLMDLIRDWSTRVWVISEYNIAKQGNKLKYWFIQVDVLTNNLLLKYEQEGSFKFYTFDFDRPAVDINAKQTLEAALGICGLKISEPIYPKFHELMIRQLNEQSFLEMMLKSNASRNEDRFYAVLPIGEYREKLTSKDAVASWQIDTTVSVKLKMYEWVTTKEKLDLFFLSGHDFSLDVNPVSPTFATTTIFWQDRDILYPPMDAFKPEGRNFDMDSPDTIQLVPFTDQHQRTNYCLHVKPNTYYRQTDKYKKVYFDKYYPDYKEKVQRFQVDDWNAIDIVFIPPFEEHAVNVRTRSECLYWHYNVVFLIGSLATNKWEIHKYRTLLGDDERRSWQLCRTNNSSVPFHIY